MVNGNTTMTDAMCRERHGQLEKDTKLLFKNIDSRVGKDICSERHTNLGADMDRITTEIKGSRALMITNIIIVIAVGIFMTGVSSMNKATASKEVGQSLQMFIEEQKMHNESVRSIIEKSNGHGNTTR